MKNSKGHHRASPCSMTDGTHKQASLLLHARLSREPYDNLISTSLYLRRLGYQALCKVLGQSYAKNCLMEAYYDQLKWQTTSELCFVHDMGILKSIVKHDQHYTLYIVTKASLTSVGGAILNQVQLLYPPTKQDVAEALQNSNYQL